MQVPQQKPAADEVVELNGGAAAAGRSTTTSVKVATERPTAIDKTTVDTTIGPADLNGARHLETHKGVHLFELSDGRVYIDQYAAVANVQSARRIVDQGIPAA